MQYLLLIYENEANDAQRGPEGQKALIAAYGAFHAETPDGVILGGDALQPISTATTVRVRDNATLTTDGPFAETKEQLGGYYLIEAPDLDAAMAVAARIPTAKTGSVEIRPIMSFD